MRPWLRFAAAGTSVLAAALVASRVWRTLAVLPSASVVGTPSLACSAARQAQRGSPAPNELPSPIAGLELTRIAAMDGAMTAPAAAGAAHLTLDANLQRGASSMMAIRRLPEAAVVLMEVATGRLLVYASHVEGGPPRDLCAEALAPSASVFKIVTAASLVEDAHLSPEAHQCYSGGEQRIVPSDLVDDPHRDKWCTTLAGALGRSVNAVFARLAEQHLVPEQLATMAHKFGYGEALPFDVPVQPSAVNIPTEMLEFARTAAGFWNTTLSPLEAAEISAIIARGGVRVRPNVVDKIVDTSGKVVWSSPDASDSGRAISRDTADKLSAMMERTIRDGTSFRAFHDARGIPFLPGIAVAGKTGTLTDSRARRYFTWFTGFAPVTPTQRAPQVAIAVLVVNGPTWQVKANGLARDVLRSYFASRNVPGVTRPVTGSASSRFASAAGGAAPVALHGKHKAR
jgi:cell division protein FtsI/penicillin-binding protein 2